MKFQEPVARWWDQNVQDTLYVGALMHLYTKQLGNFGNCVGTEGKTGLYFEDAQSLLYDIDRRSQSHLMQKTVLHGGMYWPCCLFIRTKKIVMKLPIGESNLLYSETNAQNV